MAQTRVGNQKQSVWIVEAKCLDKSASWRFDDRSEAEWFGGVVQKYWCARCPRCGHKDVVNLSLDGDSSLGWTAIASCANHTCSFAQRIVSCGDPDEVE